jgi:Cu(I)/Ag(I) efflux system membrane protein CusA/SilA
MIEALIRWSVGNRFLVLLATFSLAAWGLWAIKYTPVDALPDLSDVQVIIRTSYPGQAPQIVENQVTYPLATTMLSVPGAKTVRGYSFFGDSFVYVLFEDGTDLYWARSRVLEYLNQVQGRLPADAESSLGPDATGVGWIYQYALIDRSGRHDLAQLRSLQDWFLQYELKSLPNVAEVASIGGMVRQYQVVLDPYKLASYRVPLARVIEAIRAANRESGGSVLEMAETEYMVRASGYLQSLADFRAIPLATSATGIPVTLGDVATVRLGPEMRRGIAELDGEGETVGGVVVLRSGANAQLAIAAVKARLDELKKSLPEGVEIVTTYDRSRLIERAVDNLRAKLIEEFIVVALVCAIFLGHLRSALVADRRPAAGRDVCLHRHAVSGRERQHHVAGRYRHRHRRHGRCRHRHDRERAQAYRSVAACASRRGTERGNALAGRSPARRPRSDQRCSSACSSSHCPSSRCSRWKRRKGGCSARWR